MLSRAYSSTVPRPDERTHAIVEWWSDEEGWGSLTESDEMPGGAFVHFSAIQVEGYKSLRAGQKVDARIEGPLPIRPGRLSLPRNGSLAADVSLCGQGTPCVCEWSGMSPEADSR